MSKAAQRDREDLLVNAQRDFEEDTGVNPTGPFIPLKPVRQKGGNIVHQCPEKRSQNIDKISAHFLSTRRVYGVILLMPVSGNRR